MHLVSFTIRSLMTFMPTECKYVYIPQWVCRSHFKSHYTLWDKIMYLYAQNLRNIYSNKCISVEAVLCCDLHLVWRALYDRWKPHLVRWGEGDRNWRGGYSFRLLVMSETFLLPRLWFTFYLNSTKREVWPSLWSYKLSNVDYQILFNANILAATS